MSKLETIYKSVPYPVKVLLLNLKAWLNHRKRYTESYNKYVAEYEALWEAPLKTLSQYQLNLLKGILLECVRFVPYYKETFEHAGITKAQIEKNPFKALNTIPLLSKDARKKEVERLLNTNPERPLIETGFTSGTSGSPTKIYFDKESIERSFALWTRFHRTIGLTGTERSVRFSGRILIAADRKQPPFWVYNRIDDQLFMSSYHLTNANCKAYIEKLNRFKPEFLDGYPSALFVLASYIQSHKLVLNFKPKAIAVTAETLYGYQRLAIERAFDCKVYNQYASSEGSPLISQCTEGNLHVNLDSGIFEFLNSENQTAQPGEIAKMVVTSFRNLKTPLIRYDIGDSVLIPKQPIQCSCGCNMPVVERIIGREDDVLWTPEKGYVGRMDTAYKGIDGIVKSQLIQESPGSLLVKNCVDSDYDDKNEANFITNLKERLGAHISIEIKIVEDIPLSANGKFDAVIRKFEIPKI